MKPKKHNFYAIIHTVQLSVPIDKEKELPIPNAPYVNTHYEVRDRMYVVINPNKYNGEIYKLSKFNEVFNLILEELEITNYNINRIDVAFNTEIPFEECYKLSSYLNNLDATRTNAVNHYYTDDYKMNKRSIKICTKSYELEIYNKQLESNGRDKANTRIEFRFKNRRKFTAEIAIKTVKKILTDLPKYTDEMNENMTNALYERYLIETNDSNDGKITSFTEFVTRYYFMFFNKKILYSVHNKCLRGTASSWYYKFTKSGHTLKLYSKKEMQAYINELKKVLELFYKS